MPKKLEKVDDRELSVPYEKRWLNPHELEFEYGFSRSWQSKARMQASPILIPFIKIGGKFILYDRVRINDWLEDHEVTGGVK